MALTIVPLPYGLRDVKLYTITGLVTSSTGVDLPNARTFSFAESETFSELRGDDGLQAVRGQGNSVNWKLESGGVSLDAVKVIYGGNVTTTGTTPAQKKQFDKIYTDARPYFAVEGQAISDSGGDFHVRLHRCRATGDLTGDLADGQFWLTGAQGVALPDPNNTTANIVYSLIQNETAVALT
jgi:hypothetical protein